MKRHITRLALWWLRRHSPQSLSWVRQAPPLFDAATWERLLSGVDTRGKR